jgi:hypothetical protein
MSKENEVAQRSAEKDKRRFRAEARRSGDSTTLNLPDSDPSTPTRHHSSEPPLPTDSIVSPDPDTSEPAVKDPPKSSNKSKEKSKSNEWDLVTALTTASEIPQAGDDSIDPNELKLLALLEEDSTKMSREDKKKRRKRLAAIRKKLHQDAAEPAAEPAAEDAACAILNEKVSQPVSGASLLTPQKDASSGGRVRRVLRARGLPQTTPERILTPQKDMPCERALGGASLCPLPPQEHLLRTRR